MSNLPARHDQPFDEVAESNLMDYYARKARNPETYRTYAKCWKNWRVWCESKGYQLLPVTVHQVAEYISEMASRYKPNSLRVHLAAISVAHRFAGYNDPPSQLRKEPLSSVWKGIQFEHGK